MRSTTFLLMISCPRQMHALIGYETASSALLDVPWSKEKEELVNVNVM